MRRAKLNAGAVLVAAALSAAHAGTAPPDSAGPGSGSITIRTGTDTAIVFIDSLRAGTTPLTVDSLRAGKHLPQALPEGSPFLAHRKNQRHRGRFPGRAADAHVRVRAPRHGHHRSFRCGRVHGGLRGRNDAVRPHIGNRRTPLERHARAERVREDDTLPPQGRSGHCTCGTPEIMAIRAAREPPDDGKRQRGTYGAQAVRRGGVAVAAGIAAAYFKIKADGQNVLFQQSGDASFQRETNRLDTSAAISLLVTEVGFGFFSYYLLSD